MKKAYKLIIIIVIISFTLILIPAIDKQIKLYNCSEQLPKIIYQENRDRFCGIMWDKLHNY